MAAISSFSPSGALFCITSSDGRALVYDSTIQGNVSNSLVANIIFPSHLQTRCTSVAFASREPPADESDLSSSVSKKKKKKKSSDNNTNDGREDLIAFGTVSGSIFLYSLRQDKFLRTLGEAGVGEAGSRGHSKAVTSLCFGSGGSLLFSASKDRHVIQWNVQSGEEIRRLKADQGVTSLIALSPDEEYLFTCSSKISMWDTNSFSRLNSFPGHRSDIRHLRFLSPSYSSLRFVSSSSDRTISAWDSQNTSSSAVMVSDSQPMSLSTVCLPGKNESLVAVSGESGNVSIWATDGLPPSSGSNVPIFSTISVFGKTVQRQTDIFAVTFIDSSSLCICCGSVAQPLFYRVYLIDPDTGSYLSSIDLSSSIQSKPTKMSMDVDDSVKSSQGSSSVSVSEFTKAKRNEASFLTRVDMPVSSSLSSVPSASSEESREGKRRNSKTEAKQDFEQTLGQRAGIALSDPKNSSASVDSNKFDGPVTAMTMVSVLTQALHTDDSILLEQCLQRGGSDTRIVQETVRRLPVRYILPLLMSMVQRIYKKSSRAVTLIPWIKTVLRTHTSYLVSVPNLIKHLGGLYQLVEARLAIYPRLSKLSGRLDLLLSQIAHRKRETNSSSVRSEPENIYMEGESDDETRDFEDEEQYGDIESESGDDYELHDVEFGSDDEDVTADFDMSSSSFRYGKGGEEDENLDDDDDDDNIVMLPHDESSDEEGVGNRSSIATSRFVGMDDDEDEDEDD